MPGGRPPKSQKKAYRSAAKRAKIVVFSIVGVLLVCFVVVPLAMGGRLLYLEDQVYAAPLPSASMAPRDIEALAAVLPDPTPSPTPTPVPPTPTPSITDVEVIAYLPLRPEDRDERVKQLQTRLMELGYFDHDEATEYYGAVTESAIKLFQRSYDLEQTGIADNAVQVLLFGEDALPYRMEQGDRGTDIKSMQRRLNELGYYEEKDNGYFGLATEEALRAFQEKNKIEVTGVVDQSVYDLLFSPKARYKIDPTPTPTPTPKPTPKATKTPKPTATPKPADTPDPNIPYVESNDDPTPAPTPKPAATPQPDVPAGSYGSGVSGFLAAAQAQVGKPYILGDEGPDSYDCSGLVYYALRQAGVKTSRYSAAGFYQVESWQAISSMGDCRPGDLIFYTSDGGTRISHVAIWLGNGKIVHASTSAGKVLISDGTTPYYQRNFVLARRVF